MIERWVRSGSVSRTRACLRRAASSSCCQPVPCSARRFGSHSQQRHGRRPNQIIPGRSHPFRATPTPPRPRIPDRCAARTTTCASEADSVACGIPMPAAVLEPVGPGRGGPMFGK